MNDLSTRVRDYLDRKKPDRPQTVTSDVTSEVKPDELTKAWTEWKDYFRVPIFIMKCILAISLVVITLWALAIVEIQNDCYLSKECREWVKNR